jgi:hypothetical protein
VCDDTPLMNAIMKKKTEDDFNLLKDYLLCSLLSVLVLIFPFGSRMPAHLIVLLATHG